MKIIVVSEKEVIDKLVGKNNVNRMIIHIDHKNEKVFYETDYTRYELRELIDYKKALSILKPLCIL
ncbi:MAG TPA: hypothetical protein GX747_03690 [Tenericutes bacterium]|nr:hypothetical protein [Mycoplasmatota bacterium]